MKNNILKINQIIIFLFISVISPAYSQTYTSWITGSTADVTTTATGGACLMGGGTDNDDAIKWMIQKSGGGDFVVIRSAGTQGYNDYIYGLGTVNSVETILIDTRAKASIAQIATKIRNAEALFIAGGDQSTYVSYWKDTPVEDAINYLINTKKVPVGGTSAGCAIQGKYYYSATNSSVTSAQALANPYNTDMTIGANDFINNPILSNVIADTHYNNPDRRGRQTAFIARMWKDLGAGLNAKGIGVYEKTAVCIDQNGIAKVFAPATGNYAYFYQFDTSSTPETLVSGSPLTWNNSGKGVKIIKIEGDTSGSTTIDLNNWSIVNGSKAVYGVIKVINGTLTETSTSGGGTVSYCTSQGGDSSREWIKKVAIGTISNLSNSNGGYADFSSQVSNITKGVATTLTLTPGFSATRNLYWKVFIDLNNNGLFTDSGEQVYSIFSNQTLTPKITIPTSASVGNIRMRIIVSYNSINSSCGTYNYGETEDYALNVISGTAKISKNKEAEFDNTTVALYPNPAKDLVRINFLSEQKQEAQILIYNLGGSMVKSLITNVSAGINNMEIDLSELQSGQYIISINRGEDKVISKLIISK